MSLEIVPIKRENDPERARHVCKSKGQWAFQGSLGPWCLMVALSRVLSKPRPDRGELTANGPVACYSATGGHRLSTEAPF